MAAVVKAAVVVVAIVKVAVVVAVRQQRILEQRLRRLRRQQRHLQFPRFLLFRRIGSSTSKRMEKPRPELRFTTSSTASS